MLEVLHENANINSQQTSIPEDVFALDWNTPEVACTTMPKLQEVDVVLATDCIYDPSLVRPFVTTLSVLLRQTIATNNDRRSFQSPHSVEAHVVSSYRNAQTYGLLLEDLQRQGLLFTELERTDILKNDKPCYFYHDYDVSSIRWLKITAPISSPGR